MKPKISIITAVLNGREHVEQTIKSVIDQEIPGIEYIIIDGGSTDGTLDIVKKYEAKLSRWISQPDKGIYDALNKGIELSKGDIIGIINSDDWYARSVIKEIIDVFTKNPEIDIIHGDISLVTDKKAITIVPSVDCKRLNIRPVINHPTCFIRRRAYSAYGTFKLDYKIAADYELLLRMCLGGAKFYYMPQVITYMREGGISDRYAFSAAAEVRKIRIFYGVCKIQAYVEYVIEYILLILRNLLNHLRFRQIIYFRRKMINKINKKHNSDCK